MNFELILAKIYENISIFPKIGNPRGAAAPWGRRRIPNFWEYAHMFMDLCQNQLQIHEIPTSKNPRNKNKK